MIKISPLRIARLPEEVPIVKIVIQFTKPEEARALPVLLRHSAGTILPDRTYVLDEKAVAELGKAGIGFLTLSRESQAPGMQGAMRGERV
jgi:hypothetical protein